MTAKKKPDVQQGAVAAAKAASLQLVLQEFWSCWRTLR